MMWSYVACLIPDACLFAVGLVGGVAMLALAIKEFRRK